ncbi:MAG: tRNA (adenosine(37)-N6)-threonylcarbamoyltransferase complex ATPase subunit type 1 TsaE [Hyphomicrobiales bacterium]
MKREIIVKDISELNNAAKILLSEFPEERVFAFFGEMGAGKTTFIKSICEEIQVEDIVNSPTFAIINEYYTVNQDSVYHFDFYRMKKQEEAFDIGFEDYLYSGNYCFIEWSEKVEDLLPDNIIIVKITENKINHSRTISIEKI